MIDALIAFWKLRRPAIAFYVKSSRGPVEERAKAVILQIVKEGLSNALRHGAPASVTVRVKAAGENLEIDVFYNRLGLPSAGVTPTFGLRDMAKRVGPLGGRLAVLGQLDRCRIQLHSSIPIARYVS